MLYFFKNHPRAWGRLCLGGDKGCEWILPRNHDQRTGPQTVTRLAGPRVGGDKGETLFFGWKSIRSLRTFKTHCFKQLIKHKTYWLLFLLFWLAPFHHPFSQNKLEQVIVWYVGQGQMVTYSTPSLCIHFDMGGEFFPVKNLKKECQLKQNRVFFSHWDWDHINFAKKAYKRLNSFCRLNTPGGKGTKKKKKWLFKVPMCETHVIKTSQKFFKELVFLPHQNKDKKHTASNKNSRVVVLQNKILIPGDSPGSSEKLWIKKIKAPIEVLVVSHHGSRYSTTTRLLRNLPYLKIAVVSARQKRYGHPHPLTKAKLAKKGVPLLSTEKFNHIRLKIGINPKK